MSILAIFSGEGITKEMYDKLRMEVNWEKNQPEGATLHAASFDEKGNLHAADVWDSADAMNAFVGGRLMPAMQKLKIPPPKVEIFPAHNINAYSRITKHLLK